MLILHEYFTAARLGTSTKTKTNNSTNTNAKTTRNSILHYTIQNSRDIAGTFGVSFVAFVSFLSNARICILSKNFKDAHAE